MFEAHVGTKPGRPTLLLLVLAAALVGVLGLAWTQIRAARALGDPVAIDGLPLVVQPPLGWVRGSDPSLFGKLVQKQVWGTRIWAAERTVKFHYNDYFAQFVRMFRAAALYPTADAAIGEFPGIQYVVDRQSAQAPGQSVLRWALTPAGELLGVEYTPLAEVSHGDIYLLDDICGAVRLDREAVALSLEGLTERVGVSFEIDPGLAMLGPGDGERPGFWLLKRAENRPCWALGVFRGYLGRNRDPMELLVGEARQIWSAFETPRTRYRDDGAFVGAVFGPGGQVGASIWAVAQSPVKAAVIIVLADPAFADEANQAARQAAEEMTFSSAYPE